MLSLQCCPADLHCGAITRTIIQITDTAPQHRQQGGVDIRTCWVSLAVFLFLLTYCIRFLYISLKGNALFYRSVISQSFPTFFFPKEAPDFVEIIGEMEIVKLVHLELFIAMNEARTSFSVNNWSHKNVNPFSYQHFHVHILSGSRRARYTLALRADAL